MLRSKMKIWFFVFANLLISCSAHKRQYLVKPVDIDRWSGPYFNEHQTTNAFKKIMEGITQGRKREELSFDARKILNLDPENPSRRLNIDESPVAETFTGDSPSSERNVLQSPQERLAHMISKPIIHYEYSHNAPNWHVKDKLPNKWRKQYSHKHHYESNNDDATPLRSDDAYQDTNEMSQFETNVPYKRINKPIGFYRRYHENGFDKSDDVSNIKRLTSQLDSAKTEGIHNLGMDEQAARRRFPEREVAEEFHSFKTAPFFKRREQDDNEITEDHSHRDLDRSEQLADERSYYSKDDDENSKTHHRKFEDEDSVNQFLQSEMGLINYHMVERESSNNPEENKKVLEHDSLRRHTNPYENDNSLNDYELKATRKSEEVDHNTKRSTVLEKESHGAVNRKKMKKRKMKDKKFKVVENKISKKNDVEKVKTLKSKTKRWRTSFQPNRVFQKHPDDFYGEQNQFQMVDARDESQINNKWNNKWNNVQENDYFRGTGFKNSPPIDSSDMHANDFDVEMPHQPISMFMHHNSYQGETPARIGYEDYPIRHLSNHIANMDFGEKLPIPQSHDHFYGDSKDPIDDTFEHDINANSFRHDHHNRHGSLMGFFGNTDQGALLPAETLDGIASNWEHAHQTIHYGNSPINHNKGGHIIQAIQDDPMIDSQLSTFGIGLAMDNKHHHPSTLTHADSHLISDNMQGVQTHEEGNVMHDTDYVQQLHNYMLLNNENVPSDQDSHHQEMSSDQYQNHINNLMMKYKPLVEKVHDGSDVSSYLYQNLIPHQSAIRPHQGYDYYAYKNPWENMQLPYHIPVENHPLEDGLKGTTTEVTTEAKPDFLEAKPEIVEAKLEAAEAKPLVEAKTEFVEAKPEFLEAKPELLEAKPEPLEAKPELFEAKPELLGAKPEHFKESSEAVASPNLLKENLQGTIVGAEQASKQPKTEAINDKLGDKVNKSKDTGKSSEKIKEGLKPDLGVKSPWGEAPSKIPMQHHRSGDLLTSDPNPILQAYRQLNLLVPAALQIKALQDQLKEVKQQSALQIASLESKNKSISKIFSKEGDFFTSSPNKAIFSVNPFEKLTSEAGLVSPALIQEFVAQAKNLEPPSKSYEINDQTDGIKSALETSSSSGNKEHELPKNTNLIQPSNNQKVEILKILNLATKQQSKENERKEDTLKSTNEKSNAQSATEQLKLLMLMRNLQAKGATEKEHLNSIVSQIASNRLSDSGTATLPSYNSDINSMLLKMVLKDQNPVLSSLKSEPRYKETQLLHMNDGSLAEVFEKEKSKNNAKQNESEIIRLLVEKLQHKKHKKTKDILENPYAKIGYVGKREPLLSQPSDSNNHDTSSSSVSSFNRILQSITSHFNDDAVKETREQVNVKKSINKQRKKNSLEKIFKNKKSHEEE